jgi:hypothetical protein
MIYYDFSKLLQGVICPVVESSGGKRSIFIGWGVMCSTSYSLGGEVDFFLFFFVLWSLVYVVDYKSLLPG